MTIVIARDHYNSLSIFVYIFNNVSIRNIVKKEKIKMLSVFGILFYFSFFC